MTGVAGEQSETSESNDALIADFAGLVSLCRIRKGYLSNLRAFMEAPQRLTIGDVTAE